MIESYPQNTRTFLLDTPLRYESHSFLPELKAFNLEIRNYNVLLPNDYAEASINLETWGDVKSYVPHFNTLDYDKGSYLNVVFLKKAPTLSSFFASQMIDIPLKLQNTPSLYHSTVSTPHLRIITTVMRQGRKSYIARGYSLTLNKLYSRHINESKGNASYLFSDWRLLHSILSSSEVRYRENTISFTPTARSNDVVTFQDKYSQSHSNVDYNVIDLQWFQEALVDEIEKHIPVFSFYVKKVDKLKRKHSRGKTGKYSIAWKYVPLYRRYLTVVRWLVRDVRFQKSRTIFERLDKSLETFLLNPKSHLVYRLRQFVHTFVFQNYRKTLLKTLKSTS